MIRFLSIVFVLLFAALPAFGADPSVDIYYTLMDQTATTVTYVASFSYDQGEESFIFLETECTNNDIFTTYNAWSENGIGGFEITMNKADCLGQEFTISVTMRDSSYTVIAYDCKAEELPSLGGFAISSFYLYAGSTDVWFFEAEVYAPYNYSAPANWTCNIITSVSNDADDLSFDHSESPDRDVYTMSFSKIFPPSQRGLVTLVVRGWDGPYYIDIEAYDYMM